MYIHRKLDLAFFALLFLALLLRVLIYLNPYVFWWSEPLLFITPALALLALVGLGYWLLYRRWLAAGIALGSIILLWPFVQASLPVNLPPTKPAQFSLVSFNVSSFGKPAYYYFYNKNKDKLNQGANQAAMVERAFSIKSDILCFQEFYHNPNDSVFNGLARLANAYENYTYNFDTLKINKSLSGLVIATNFPILSSGEVKTSTEGASRIIYADVKIEQDTIRIVNYHLQSAQFGKVLTKAAGRGVVYKMKQLYYRYRKTQPQKFDQLAALKTFVEESPYPVIAAGDLNHSPYSYPYHVLNRRLTNSYESAGTGFGFTLNHRWLFFLRIDHQFYSDGLEAVYSNVLRKSDTGDHYPLATGYRLK